MDRNVISVIIVAIISILIFIILREFFNWYIKRNEQIKLARKQNENQEIIISLLKEQSELLRNINDKNNKNKPLDKEKTE